MDPFAELSLLIVIATLVAIVMRLLRQPLIIGHILTGLIVGPLVLDVVQSDTLALLGKIGIAILLFTVGLHLNPDVIRQFGRVALITGVGQVVMTSAAGFLLALALGYSPLTAFYVSVALSFSSTIIIMKLLADRGDLEVLYAKIAIGFLLVQDLIAVLLLLGLPLFAVGEPTVSNALRFALSGAMLIAFIVAASRFFISKQSTFITQSQEFLFLFAITWGVGIAALFQYVGFSLESGALVAGIALAALPARREVTARLTPLRDFFIVMFFIFLGAQMQLGDVASNVAAAIAFSMLILIGNPLILMTLTGLLGYRKKTSLQTGLTVAQMSEFSFILVALGVSLGHVSGSVLSLVTLVGLITISGSTYLVSYSEKIYVLLEPLLGVFERRGAREEQARKREFRVVLFGCNRIGYDFLASLKRFKEPFIVVDYDPEIIEELKKKGIATEFGDASDISFLESFDFSRAELVISTIPDNETNVLIHRIVRAASPEAVVIAVAHRVSDALRHYGEGIDYVVLPHFLGGKYAAEIVIANRSDKTKYLTLRSEHIEDLKLRAELGHEHPQRELNR